MKDVKQYKAKLIGLNQLSNSRNGNPRYLVTFEYKGGVFSAFTKNDSNLVYQIEKYLGERVDVSIGRHYGNKTINTLGPDMLGKPVTALGAMLKFG